MSDQKPQKSLEERKVEALEKIANKNFNSGRYAIAVAIYMGLLVSSCISPRARASELPNDQGVQALVSAQNHAPGKSDQPKLII